MKNKISSMLKDPEFQRQAAHVVGTITTSVVMIVLTSTVHKVVDVGIDKLMDKIQNNSAE